MSVCMQRQILIKILKSLYFLPKRQVRHVFVRVTRACYIELEKSQQSEIVQNIREVPDSNP